MINVIIFGYGNLGRAVHHALPHFPDFVLTGICSRRAGVYQLPDGIPCWTPEQFWAREPTADIIINCGGSAADLPRTTPLLAAKYCVVDSFDTHADIPDHIAATDAAAQIGRTLCLVSAGWDPGIFSLARALGTAFMPNCAPATFWGPGVSQGHSDALRNLPDVLDARQYTIPCETAVHAVLTGKPSAASTMTHKRVCYVVPKAGADINKLTAAIKSMPNYFAGYEVDIHYITKEKLDVQHRHLPHGGSVICTAKNSAGLQTAQLQLTLASNPGFTAGVLLAAARAAVRLYRSGQIGCRTMLDAPPILYAAQPPEELVRSHL